MEPGNDISSYHRERTGEIERLITRPAGSWTVEDFHDLRVSLKKLKALYALVHFGAAHFPRKTVWRPYRLLFRQAGRVRELQLELQALRELKLDRALRDHMLTTKRRLRLELRKFHHINGPWLRQKLRWMQEKTGDYLQKVSDSELKTFLARAGLEIKQVLSAHRLSETELHGLRKKIKTYLYISTLAKEENRIVALSNEMQQLLGKWHDTFVLRSTMQRIVHSRPLHPEQFHIQALIRDLGRSAAMLIASFESKKGKLYREYRAFTREAA
jgi:CHAD domain-containing protein